MFSTTQKHPSDRLLLCAIDGELATRRARALHAHLRLCDHCHTRFATLVALGGDISRVCRDEPAGQAPSGEVRDRLRTQMTQQAAAWNHSRWFRLRRAMSALPFALRMGLSAAMLGLIVQAVWLSNATMTRTPTTPEMEVAALPIHTLTPGAVGSVNLDALCAGRTVDKPPVATAVREVVLRGYRMEHVAAHEYELDYLITPELGGVPDARNLWPERYATTVWNARVKDDLEGLLPQLICRGQLDLTTAQRDIADNWIAAYKKYFKTDHPIRKPIDLRDDDIQPRASARLDLEAFQATVVMPRVSLVASRHNDSAWH